MKAIFVCFVSFVDQVFKPMKDTKAAKVEGRRMKAIFVCFVSFVDQQLRKLRPRHGDTLTAPRRVVHRVQHPAGIQPSFARNWDR